MKQSSREWWSQTRSDSAALHAWLRRQYVGEMSAVGLLADLLVRYGGEAEETDWHVVHKIMRQEAMHAMWIKGLLDARGIKPEVEARGDQRYWKDILPQIESWGDAVAAGANAEEMRLHRIRAICEDEESPIDVRLVFQRILPQEEWHAQEFGRMKTASSSIKMSRFHEKGLDALNLALV